MDLSEKLSNNQLLQKAVYAGDLAACKRLLNEGACPDWRGSDTLSLLMRATNAGNLDIAAALIDFGADLNFLDDRGRSPLTITFDKQIIQLLLERGASLSDGQALELMYTFDGDNWIRGLLASRAASSGGWQDSPRQLYSRILGYKGSSLARDVLLPSVESMRDILMRLAGWQEYPEGKAKGREELEELYAFSRISDVLLLSFQAGSAQEEQVSIPPVSPAEYVQFFEALGFSSFELPQFHPFFHEIVSVDNNAPEDSQPELLNSIWPGMRFGKLLFSRQGVAIRAGRNVVDKAIAETATLYCAYRRRRPTHDPSCGWGSNSQWRNAIRRDYEDAGYYYYNVGQETVIDADAPACGQDYYGMSLSPEEVSYLIDLVRFRQALRGPKDPLDLDPYGCSVRERKAK